MTGSQPVPGVPFNPLAPPVVPASGAPVPGGPDARGPVVPAGVVVGKKIATTTEMLKSGIPRVKVIAIVGANNVITDEEIRESVWQQYEELAKLEGRARQERERQLYSAALKKTIERELILDEMYAKLKKANKASLIEELKESASQSADRHIREMKKHLGAKTDDDLNTFFRLRGLTLPVFRRQMEREFMASQYVSSLMKETGRLVGLAEIREFYDRHPDEFKSPDRVRWQHLFVSFAKYATPQAAYNQAEALRQKAAAGEDLGALSKQFDHGLAGQQGGFGAGEKRGEIAPKDIEPTVWTLKVGQVSGLIQTPTGYHIVKVVERDYESVLPCDAKVQSKIRDKLNESVYDQNKKKMVEDLWRKGVVRILDE
ncbi:peptidylprolyl isomerase [Frigoriglobus tundricola]|uniref:PpiC domain-containing protein n=1 Tax=Frigoriglobus tundricola TaxID=2774151 RepID=A0A6M5Z2G3_9BACT|nr:peptidyl-prolyl cis-trans isomerase [Frigoriglobus tundricola]QJW99713.1 hypothetical protein FTUN_7336 [Frigoriglobus tundricola]